MLFFDDGSRRFEVVADHPVSMGPFSGTIADAFMDDSISPRRDFVLTWSVFVISTVHLLFPHVLSGRLLPSL